MVARSTYLLRLLIAAAAFLDTADGFVVTTSSFASTTNFVRVLQGSSNSGDAAAPASATVSTLSPPEQKVYDILEEMHDVNYPFRLVVIGNGAILETTSVLGPTMKVGTSPRSGEPLVTLASSDQSFEFHIMLAQVSKITMTEKESPATGDLMQVARFLTDEGKPMCSLILADKGEEAKAWFGTLLEKYDNGDIQL